MLGRAVQAFCCVLFRLAAAKDYYGSPDPTGTDLSLEACIKRLVENDRCLLRPGHYYIDAAAGGVTLTKTRSIARKNIALAAPFGDVLIDGTAELENLEWKSCSDAQEQGEVLECVQDVWVANIGTTTVSQLFVGGNDAETRRLLFPARWPNPKASKLFNESGLPSWAPVTDTYASWSFPDGSKSGRMTQKGGEPPLDKRKPGKFAKFVDNGGALIEKREEVEEDMYITIRRQGPGFLNESNVSVEGANIVIVYGKGSVEIGRVYKHKKGSNEFEIEHPECTTFGYGSCGKGFWKSSFLSYFFENSLGLLDQPNEYYFELRKSGGNRLFLKLEGGVKPNSSPNMRLWTKHTGTDFFMTLAGSSNFSITGIRTFATAFTSHSTNSNMRVSDCSFLYSSVSRRNLGDYGQPKMMVFHNAHYGQFVNNTWMYAEGTAFEAKGNRMTMSDNFFRYNGIFSTNGPQTIKWTSTNGTISHNSLEWNGQVTGWKLMGPGQVITKNHVKHQNWGKTLHDGAGIHVQMSAAPSEFSYNWIHDGHFSLGIRFDTSQEAKFEKPTDIGHDAQVHHNVLWGIGNHLAMKGERMNVTSNTILNASKFSVIRAFGNQQQMHKLTVAKYNAFALTPTPRGKIYSGRRRTGGCDAQHQCIPSDPDGTMPKGWENKKDTTGDGAKKDEGRPQGPVWKLPPGVDMDQNLVYKDLCWDGLVDCPHQDFRPKIQNGANPFKYGAYDGSTASYWIPGRRTRGPSHPIPVDTAQEVPFGETLGLAFLPSETCDKHIVSLTWKGGGIREKLLEGGANIWEPGGLPKNEKITWTVTEDSSKTGCSGFASTWSFTTAELGRTTTTSTSTTTKRTTTVTTTTSTATTTKCGSCCDTPPEGVTEKKNQVWCDIKKKKGNCNIPTARARCQKTCKHCEPSTPTTSLEPVSTTSLDPVSTTSLEPVSTTSLEPVSTTTLEPVSTTTTPPQGRRRRRRGSRRRRRRSASRRRSRRRRRSKSRNSSRRRRRSSK